MSRSRRVAGVLSIAVGAALTVGACSSSASNGSGGTTNSAASHGSGSNQAAVAEAKASIEKVAAPVTINYKPGKLSGSVAGKKIVIMSNETATGRKSNDKFLAVAKRLGFDAKTVVVGSSSEQVANAFDSLVNDKSIAGVIVGGGGMDPNRWPKQFQELTARKVPIVLYAMPKNSAWRTKTVISIESVGTGVDQTAANGASWITADSNGSADTVIFNVPGSAVLQAVHDTFLDKYKSICNGCKVATQDIDPTTIGTQLPSTVVSYLQKHPSTKYVYMEFGDMVTGVPQALKAAGLSGIRIISQAATATDRQYVSQGEEAANFGFPFDLIAYVGVDALARGILTGDMSAAGNWIMPSQLMTKDNAATFNEDGTAAVAGLDQYFGGLWGVV